MSRSARVSHSGCIITISFVQITTRSHGKPMVKRKSPDAGLLCAALEGLELQKQRLEQYIAEVRRVLGSRTQKSVTVGVKRRNRMTAAGRKRIAAGQKKRWAEYRKQKAAAAKK